MKVVPSFEILICIEFEDYRIFVARVIEILCGLHGQVI
jgi:hypothetical protein